MRRHGIGRQLQRSQSGSTPHDRITIPQICSSRSPALNRPRQSALRYPALVSNHPPIHSLRRHPPLNHEPLHRRPTCSIGLAPVTHLIRGTQIPIAHAAPPTYPFPRFPCMGLFFVKEFARASNLLSFVSFFVSFFVRSQSPFLRPDPRFADVVARRSCQGWPSHQPFPTSSAVARPHLDSFEHDGTLGAIGMTIRGEPAFGRGSVAPQPCIRWVQGPEP